MNEFRTKITDDGRIVIPAACRKQLQLEAGEEMIIRIENNNEMHILSLKDSLKKAQAVVQKYAKNQSLVKKLKQMRKEDARHE